ncbi:Poly(3-hydroxyalkanoate) polymerase subunit PhaE [Sphingomonas antarctica]|uniref:poly(R)-hydroxyalkanoic acid synthase subunit PhaE n=1 Tax=Sphingomonas antarctica TaxID=2040274 RepID=UPI0039E90F38
MSSTPPFDPLGLMRGWVAEWEKVANKHGAEMLAKPEVAQAMQGMTAATMQAQAATQDMMAKALAAANLPSKTDFEAMAQRLSAIEASLARIEGNAAPVMPRPTPKRTRKPAA